MEIQPLKTFQEPLEWTNLNLSFLEISNTCYIHLNPMGK